MHLELFGPDIIILVDSRLGTGGQKACIEEFPKYNFFFNSNNSQSRGVDILIHRNSPINISDTWRDNDGNAIILKGLFDGSHILICGLYGPNRDSPSFFDMIFDKIESYGIDRIIVGGDWNVPQNFRLDTLNYVTARNNGSRRVILDAMENGEYIDPFRVLHKNKVDLTWNRWGGGQGARLDFFLTSSHVGHFLEDCKSIPPFRSDHKPILLTVDFKRVSKGKGVWKFNNMLLLDQDFIKLAENEIKFTCSKHYVSPLFDNFINDAPPETLDTFLAAPLLDLESLTFDIDYDCLLTAIFNDIKNLAITYSSGRRNAKSNRAKGLLLEIDRLGEGPEKNALLDEYNHIIEDMSNEHLALVSKLSKTCGERPEKWFLRLEKSCNDQRFIGELIDNAGNHITSQTLIENEIRLFYKDLYSLSGRIIESPNEIVDFLPPDCNPPKLSEEQADFLDSDFTLEEISLFLKNTKEDSSPGYSGITYKFIKHFFTPLGHFLVRAAKDIFRKGIFPQPLRIGIISLLPKGEKDKKYLQNWRPIVLLDSVYKIFSGVLSNRVNKVLPSIISNSQSGFVPGRSMFDSLRLVMDVIEWGKAHSQAGIIISIDYRKAFDTLSHSFIQNALYFFGFGEIFRKWIGITQNKFQVCTSHSGNISPCFYLQRGVKQGDPVSPGLFIICLEILSLKIQYDSLVSGYRIGNTIIKQSYFADDTLFFLSRCEASVRRVVEILNSFGHLSGLFINQEKSLMMEFGISPGIPFCPDIPFVRAKKMAYLGLVITWNLIGLEVNITDKLKEVKKIANSWRNRNLSIYGRNVVAKSLMISKIYNVLMVIPNLKIKHIKEFESAIFDFLWGGRDVVRRKDAMITESHGGLNLPNIQAQITAFKISWFRRLFSSDKLWAKVLNEFLLKIYVNQKVDLTDLLFNGDLWYIKIANKISSTFWKSVFKAPISPSRDFIKKNPETSLDLCLWDSSFIKHNLRSLSPKKFPSLKNKIKFVSDLVNQNTNQLFSLVDFTAIHGEVNRAHFDIVIHSVKTFLESIRLNVRHIFFQNPCRPFWLYFFNLTPKGCNGWTRLIRLNRSDNIRVLELKWEDCLGRRLGPLFWDRTYKNHNTILFNNKLRWFQYQINRGSLKVNRIISKFIPNQSDRCTFCNIHEENIVHLLWSCDHVSRFLDSLGTYLDSLDINWPPRSREAFLFGDHRHPFLSKEGYIYLQIKYYVWVTRCLKKNLEVAALKNSIRSCISLDLFLIGRGGGGQTIGLSRRAALFQFIGNLADRIGIG